MAIVCRGRGEAPAYLLLYGSAFVIYGAAVLFSRRDGWRGSVRLILCFSLLFHLVLAPVRPPMSTDVYRYLWEGRLVLQGINPLMHAPAEPALVGLRDAVWRHVNNKSVPSVYPTVSQAFFGLSALAAPGSVLGWKLLLSAFDLVAAICLAAWLRTVGQPPQKCLVYAWNPLPITEFALNGHQDAIGIALLCLAFWLAALSGRRVKRQTGLPISDADSPDFLTPSLIPALLIAAAAGAALAASVFSKGFGLVCAPFLLLPARGRGLFAAGLGLTGTALALPLFLDGMGGARAAPWTGFGIYYRNWERNDGVFQVVRWLAVGAFRATPEAARYGAFGLGILIGLGAFFAVRRTIRRTGTTSIQEANPGGCGENAAIVTGSLTAIGALLLLSPTVYPWYAAWLLPLAAVADAWAWVLFSGLVGLDYLNVYRGQESPIVLAFEFIPVLAVLGWGWHRRHRTARQRDGQKHCQVSIH